MMKVTIYNNKTGMSTTVVNEIGNVGYLQLCDITELGDGDDKILEVKADGEWILEFTSIDWFFGHDYTLTTSFSGRGNDIAYSRSSQDPYRNTFKATESATICRATHNGNSNFIVEMFELSEKGEMTVVFNEIGYYKGETVISTVPGKMYIFNVIADGDWTFNME